MEYNEQNELNKSYAVSDEHMSKRVSDKNVIRPLTAHNIYSYYIPMNGTISYYAFSLHVSLPGGLIRLVPYCSLGAVNCLLFNSHVGIGLYLYTRSHMKIMPIYNRIMYSVFGSVIFNFGSVLLQSLTTRSLLPNNTVIKILFSLISSYAYITIAKEYLETIDKLI